VAPRSGLLAPVLPLAPSQVPPAVETPSPSIRFGPPPSGPIAPPGYRPSNEVETLPQLPTHEPPVRRAPLPSLLTTGPGRRSLSAFGAIVVSAVTASVVVAVALVAFGRRDRAIPAASTTPPTPTAPPAVGPVPSQTAVAAPHAPSASPDPATLPLGFGYLTILSPADANVYLSGKLLGPVNKPMRVRCGRWFIRLAAPQEGRYPEWVTPGETVVVPCQESARLEMSPRGL
jgi:hypothetical protein